MIWFRTPKQRRLERMTPEQMREESERVARYAGEQLQRKPSKVELFARAYCKELGYDPDAIWYPAPMASGRPRWTKYRGIAERELHQQAVAAGLAALPNDTATP